MVKSLAAIKEKMNDNKAIVARFALGRKCLVKIEVTRIKNKINKKPIINFCGKHMT